VHTVSDSVPFFPKEIKFYLFPGYRYVDFVHETSAGRIYIRKCVFPMESGCHLMCRIFLETFLASSFAIFVDC
jgi:hypothetical protein